MSLILLLIPLLSSVVMLLLSGSLSKYIAAFSSLLSLTCTALMLSQFNADGSYNFYFTQSWIAQWGIYFKLGIDGISMLMVMLTNLLMPLIIFNSFERKYSNKFYALVMLMQFALLGVFISLDGFLFYIFWELALIPIYFISAMWGDEQRVKVTIKFFIYTFFGSLFMLASLIYVYLKTPGVHSFAIDDLYAVNLSTQESIWVFLGFFIAFAIKMPIFPLHTWQPDTYQSSPNAGTMLLSGIMLKMGTYGAIRWMIPIAPEALSTVIPYVIVLTVFGIIYAAVIAIRLNNIKRVIAYSSISHVGLIAAAILSVNITAWQGAMIQMFSHGVNIVGLWWICDILNRRLKTYDLNLMGGIANYERWFAVLSLIIFLGATGVPLTNGFVGEFLCLNGIFNYNMLLGIISGFTIIFCAVYMLRVYGKIMYGTSNNEVFSSFQKLNLNETMSLAIISVLVLVIGIFPQYIFQITESSLSKLLQIIQSVS